MEFVSPLAHAIRWISMKENMNVVWILNSCMYILINGNFRSSYDHFQPLTQIKNRKMFTVQHNDRDEISCQNTKLTKYKMLMLKDV